MRIQWFPACHMQIVATSLCRPYLSDWTILPLVRWNVEDIITMEDLR